jgi:hypothetical protein
MTKPHNIPWPRVLAESSIIVASILLAVWVDAWWSDRQSRIDEVNTLASLHEELQGLIRIVDGNKLYVQALKDSTLKIANASIDSDPEVTDGEIDRMIGDVLWYVDPSFTSAPLLELLVNNGDIDMISNSGLRRQLGVFIVNLAKYRLEIHRESDYFNGTLMPYVQEHVNMAQVYSLEFQYPGFPDRVYPPYNLAPPKSNTSNRDAMQSRGFQNILLHQLTVLTNIMERTAELVLQLTHVTELVEIELEILANH